MFLDILKIVGYLIVFAGVLMLAYFTTKKVSSYTNMQTSKSKYITIEDRVGIAKDQSILIASVNGKKYLIGSSSDNLTLIDYLQDGELIPVKDDTEFKTVGEMMNVSNITKTFSDALTKASHKKSK